MIQGRSADSDADRSAVWTKRTRVRLWFTNEGFVDGDVSLEAILGGDFGVD